MRVNGFVAAVVAVGFVGCGGGSSSSSSTSPTTSATPQLQVGGTYATAVTLTESACGAVPVQSQPTTVTHAAGATRLSLTHAGASYAGTVQTDGRFSTDPTIITVSGTANAIRIDGRFTTTGLDAAVTVDQTAPGAATCRYLVRWIGTKEGAANVIL